MYPYDEQQPQNLMPTPYQQQGGVLGGQANRALAMRESPLNSPGAAMAAAAANNLGAMSSYRQPTQNPIQAYQAAVAFQANNRLRQEQLARESDPYWAYEEGRRRGHIPEDMSYFDYRARATTGIGPKNSTYAPTIGTKSDGTRVMIAPKYDVKTNKWDVTEMPLGDFTPDRTLKDVDVGGGTYTIDPITGQPLNFYERGLRPEDTPETKYLQQQAGSQEKQDAEFRAAAATIPALDIAIADTLQLKDDIASGKFQNTGFFEGRLGRFTDEETAKLYAKQVLQALKNLQITNLAPVTENEIRMIEGLYASVLQDPAANIGALTAAVEMLEKKKANIQAMGTYWMDNGQTLKDYGIYQMMNGQSPAPRPTTNNADPEVEF